MSEWAGLPLVFWIAAPAVIVFAYTVFGMTGFGSTMIAVPILANWVPLATLVPVLVLSDIASALFVGGTNRHHVSKAELKRLVPFLVLGLALGVTVLVSAPQKPLIIALGLFSLVAGVTTVLNPVPRGRICALWSAPTGLVAGSFAATFGIAGPVYVAYLTGRLDDKDAIRATISTMISISATLRGIFYTVAGLVIKAGVLAGIAFVAPLAILGVRIGSRIHTRLSAVQLRRAIGLLLVACGGILLARSLL
jgi:uncharacterized protein